MFEILRHIEYLLMSHDCVSVPGLGAFVAQYIPAEINYTTGCVVPPRREFSFNQAVNYNDGLLNASIARRNSVDFEAATSIVADDVRAIRLQLEGVGEVALGRVGVLRYGRDGGLEFLPNNRSNLSPTLSAMEAVALPGTGVDSTLKIVRRRSVDSFMFRAASIAASLILMVMLAASLTTPIIPDNAVKASLGFIENVGRSRDTQINFNPEIDLSIAMPNPTTSVTEVVKRQKLADMNYFVVVASLANHTEAQKFIDDCSQSDVEFAILDGEAHSRVVVSAGQNLSELSCELLSWRERFPQAWIYQRK